MTIQCHFVFNCEQWGFETRLHWWQKGARGGENEGSACGCEVMQLMSAQRSGRVEEEGHDKLQKTQQGTRGAGDEKEREFGNAVKCNNVMEVVCGLGRGPHRCLLNRLSVARISCECLLGMHLLRCYSSNSSL